MFVDLTRLPKHVAIIMDGNGRWAQRQGQVRTLGHNEGSKSVRRVVRAASRLGVEALTLFAFSEQNWERPEPEVFALMMLLRDYLISEREEILENSIRLRSIGRTHKLPKDVRDVLTSLEAETKNADGMTLTLALSYGGREELVDAIDQLQSTNGSVTVESIGRSLPSMEVGPVDLMVRTGGEKRISNFLLWGSAYAELVFSDALWPDFGESDLYGAVREYQNRDRRFGRVHSDLNSPAPSYLKDPAKG